MPGQDGRVVGHEPEREQPLAEVGRLGVPADPPLDRLRGRAGGPRRASSRPRPPRRRAGSGARRRAAGLASKKYRRGRSGRSPRAAAGTAAVSSASSLAASRVTATLLVTTRGGIRHDRRRRRTRSRQADQPLDLGSPRTPASRAAPAPSSTRRRASSRARSTSRRSRRSTGRSRPRRPALPAWRALSLAKRAELFFAIRELFHARREEIAKHLTREHGKVLSDALGEVTRGLEVIEFCCGHPASPEGRDERAGLERRRRVLDPAAARRRRGHHAVQLPGDGPDVDVGAGARLREHVRAQAVGEGSRPRRSTRPSC